MRVLVVNAGSSSLKLTLLSERDETLAAQNLPAPRAKISTARVQEALQSELAEADLVVHRIVHGGERFREAILIDAGVERELRALCDLAPLHQAKSLSALDAVSAQLRDLPAVACFDTAFHATMAEAAATYALPRAWRERWGLRRYGFHGLSHAWVARHVAEIMPSTAATRRIVSCHLGAGASVCAIADARSVDTTMGFTPLEGLVMATRSGSVDPGMLLWLLEHERIDERELAQALEHESGLQGLAGSSDMREILTRAQRGEGAAILARDVYVHRLRAAIGAAAATLDGLDVLVFTGGVGEHAPAIREQTVAGLGFLGLEIEPERNRTAAGDADISRTAAPPRTWVLTAREDLEMAVQARQVMAAAQR